MDWWYVRAYPGGSDLMDPATRVLVPWLRDQAAREGAGRWFFIRYWDLSGYHLRLRLSCPPDGVDRLHERVPEVERLLGGLRAEPYEALVRGEFPGTLPSHRRARPCLYAPELGKYGGTAGVALAEELFTRGSAWYLDAGVAGLERARARAGLALAYMRGLVSAALPDPAAFWAAHRRQWGWQLRMAVPGQEELRERVVRVHGTPAPGGVDLDGQIANVVETLDAAEAACVPVTRAELLLNYLHMDLNRWGFVPAEECLLGLAAAN
ncbi:lantibiotic dehydratase C-terminal domain-containing protein [Nonomuraea sediminis]|uniref:lantibiotic dehydratase C-terminal domain-containing protein n=1 Tax=Nonomuraea sediminis TaxID=2835864 RepID=UPI001BDD5094|nr:lantibiotic dehydratase C-terminal domain-containing protein [Nonomuraea sediminis]